MTTDQPWRPRRRERRVLLALLTDASNLSGIPLAHAAQVGVGYLYPLLERLERRGVVTSRQGERDASTGMRRRFYGLTPEGRVLAMEKLGLQGGGWLSEKERV